jgi:hypothetical protein
LLERTPLPLPQVFPPPASFFRQRRRRRKGRRSAVTTPAPPCIPAHLNCQSSATDSKPESTSTGARRLLLDVLPAFRFSASPSPPPPALPLCSTLPGLSSSTHNILPSLFLPLAHSFFPLDQHELPLLPGSFLEFFTTMHDGVTACECPSFPTPFHDQPQVVERYETPFLPLLQSDSASQHCLFGENVGKATRESNPPFALVVHLSPSPFLIVVVSPSTTACNETTAERRNPEQLARSSTPFVPVSAPRGPKGSSSRRAARSPSRPRKGGFAAVQRRRFFLLSLSPSSLATTTAASSYTMSTAAEKQHQYGTESPDSANQYPLTPSRSRNSHHNGKHHTKAEDAAIYDVEVVSTKGVQERKVRFRLLLVLPSISR